MHVDLFLCSSARALVELAGLSLIGQGALGLLAGKQRHANLFYRILETIARPAVKAVRFITPRFVRDAHVPMLTLVLLFCLWILLALVKRYLSGLHHLI